MAPGLETPIKRGGGPALQASSCPPGRLNQPGGAPGAHCRASLPAPAARNGRSRAALATPQQAVAPNRKLGATNSCCAATVSNSVAPASAVRRSNPWVALAAASSAVRTQPVASR